MIDEMTASRMQVHARLTRQYQMAKYAPPGSPRRGGIEDEWLVVNRDDGTMGNVVPFFERLLRLDADLSPVRDDVTAELIGITHPRYGELTTDAGYGTFEWASLPQVNLRTLAQQRDDLIALLIPLLADEGQVILGVGRQPVTPGDRTTWVNKGRYEVMRSQFPSAIDVATEAASQQVQVWMYGVDDMILSVRNMQALSGIITAIGANSSVFHGQSHPQALASRQSFWPGFTENQHPGRAGVSRTDFSSIDEYTKWMVNHQYVLRKVVLASGEVRYVPVKDSFAEFAADLNDEEFEVDAKIHEGCLWHDARPRFVYGTGEFRMPCQQPQETGIAMSALIFGLVQNQKVVTELVNSYDWSVWYHSRETAIRHGLKGRFNETLQIGDIAIILFTLASEGLEQREYGEDQLLDPLQERVVCRTTPAEQQIEIFDQAGVQGLIDAFAYRRLDYPPLLAA